jgi:hypothetical protein
MSRRAAAAAVGAGVTTFLAVAVAVIELLHVEFSALVGLPVGLLVGAATAVVVTARYDALAPPARYAVDAAAGFGFAVVAVLAVSYVNFAGLRSELSTDVTVGAAAVAAALAAVASWLTSQ